MSEDEVRLTRAAYYGLISEIDDHVGRVIGYLKASGQYDNTLIVFTCDHGEQLGDHHLLGKLGYFDESFRIPLIIRDPSPEADTSRGRIVEQFTETIDVMPTILAWLGPACRIPATGCRCVHSCTENTRRLAHRGGITSTTSAPFTTTCMTRSWTYRQTSARWQ